MQHTNEAYVEDASWDSVTLSGKLGSSAALRESMKKDSNGNKKNMIGLNIYIFFWKHGGLPLWMISKLMRNLIGVSQILICNRVLSIQHSYQQLDMTCGQFYEARLAVKPSAYSKAKLELTP